MTSDLCTWSNAYVAAAQVEDAAQHRLTIALHMIITTATVVLPLSLSLLIGVYFFECLPRNSSLVIKQTVVVGVHYCGGKGTTKLQLLQGVLLRVLTLKWHLCPAVKASLTHSEGHSSQPGG